MSQILAAASQNNIDSIEFDADGEEKASNIDTLNIEILDKVDIVLGKKLNQDGVN